MTTETENQVDHETFDLGEVLAGRSYPETTVEVYFDEKLGSTINELNKQILVEVRRGNNEKAEELQSDLDGLVKLVEDAKYTFHLRSIPEVTKNAILKTVTDEFPIKRDLLGRPEEDLERDQTYTRLLWAEVITRVEDPNGATSPMTEALAEKLQHFAPASAQEAINDALEELTTGAKSGFEYASQQVDFL